MRVNLFFLLAFGFIAAMVLYFVTHPSYEKSLEAKFYFETGNYELSYNLAQEAFELDKYNKMATTIMTQSQYALRYVHYIEDAKKYIKEIKYFVSTGEIDASKRAKVRMISKIMVESYKKLAPSVVVDQALIEEAKEYYEKFEKLLEKATQV